MLFFTMLRDIFIIRTNRNNSILGIQDAGMLAVNWSATQLTELDLASTELSEKALLALFAVMPKLTYLAVPFCDGFTDKVVFFDKFVSS